MNLLPIFLFLVASQALLPKIGLISDCSEFDSGICQVDFDVGSDGFVAPQYMIDEAGYLRVPLWNYGLEIATEWNSSHVFVRNGSRGGCDFYTYLGANALVNVSAEVNGRNIVETCLWTECSAFKGWTEQNSVGMQGLVNCGSSWKFLIGYENVTHQVQARNFQQYGDYVYIDSDLVSKWATVELQFGRREVKCGLDNLSCKGSVYKLDCSLYWDGPQCAQLKLAAHREKAYQYIPVDISGCSGQFAFSIYVDLKGVTSVSIELMQANYLQLEVPVCLNNISVPGEILVWSNEASVVVPAPSVVEEDSNWWLWLIVAMGGVVLVGAVVLTVLLTVPRCKKSKQQGEYGLTVLSEF